LAEYVDAKYVKFVKALARNRGVSTDTVLSKFGQGRVLTASAARAANMIDGVVDFRTLLGKLASGESLSSPRGSQAIATVAAPAKLGRKIGPSTLATMRWLQKQRKKETNKLIREIAAAKSKTIAAESGDIMDRRQRLTDFLNKSRGQ